MVQLSVSDVLLIYIGKHDASIGINMIPLHIY